MKKRLAVVGLVASSLVALSSAAVAAPRTSTTIRRTSPTIKHANSSTTSAFLRDSIGRVNVSLKVEEPDARPSTVGKGRPGAAVTVKPVKPLKPVKPVKRP